jgi:hypothetical protein
MRIIPVLGDLRGSDWQKLVVKLAGCSGCNADSFRAMRGCVQCSRQIIKRYKGTDTELLKNYRECQKEVEAYLLKRDQ